jgi:hypothetical protein
MIVERVRRILLSAAIGVAACLLAQSRGVAAEEDKPVEETQKNIQVLKGMPTSQIFPVMYSIRGALGVKCVFCHVVNGDKWEMEKDDKDEKKIARKMMQMVLDINRVSFDGKPEVSCFTCHRGFQRPLGVMPLPQAVMPRPDEAEAAQRPTLPSAQEILDKYARSVGGAEAAARVKTLAMKGTRESSDGKPAPLEIYTEGTEKMLVVATTPNGPVTQGYNGKSGWVKTNRGVHEMDPSEVRQVRDALTLYEPLKTATSAAGMRVIRIDKVGDRDAYVVVSGDPAKRTRTRLYFDTQTGLLLRSLITTESMLGAIPEQTDYDDYRDVGGVKLPFSITYSNVDLWSSATRKFTEIRPNVPMEKEKFDPPAASR